MEFSWLIINRSKLRDHRAQIVAKDRELANQGNELHELRNGVRQSEAKHSREIFLLTEQAKSATVLAAEKQREIATLRTQLQEQKLEHKAERTEWGEERKKFIDWITKGTTGLPVFAELKEDPAPAPEPVKPIDLANDPVESDLTEAIRKVGRSPRAVTKFVEHKRDADFSEAMSGLGVRKIFEEDRAVGEAEAIASKAQ